MTIDSKDIVVLRNAFRAGWLACVEAAPPEAVPLNEEEEIKLADKVFAGYVNKVIEERIIKEKKNGYPEKIVEAIEELIDHKIQDAVDSLRTEPGIYVGYRSTVWEIKVRLLDAFKEENNDG